MLYVTNSDLCIFIYTIIIYHYFNIILLLLSYDYFLLLFYFIIIIIFIFLFIIFWNYYSSYLGRFNIFKKYIRVEHFHFQQIAVLKISNIFLNTGIFPDKARHLCFLHQYQFAQYFLSILAQSHALNFWRIRINTDAKMAIMKKSEWQQRNKSEKRKKHCFHS